VHIERISRGDSQAERWLLLAHGIYGSGSNWRGIARRITNQRPEWGVMLADLRGHGKSPAGEPPHTLQAAANDLRDLAPAAIAGHSFGGKVMLVLRSMIDVAQTWVLDASPSSGTMQGSSTRVLETLERLPKAWEKREDFIAAVTAEGHDEAVAQWLAMNIVDGQFRLDTNVVRGLLEDYFARDLWTELFEARGDVEYVIADKSPTIDEQARLMLESSPPHVHVHHVHTDHWLHVEAPEVVIDLFAKLLR
jgi:esterase